MIDGYRKRDRKHLLYLADLLRSTLEVDPVQPTKRRCESALRWITAELGRTAMERTGG